MLSVNETPFDFAAHPIVGSLAQDDIALDVRVFEFGLAKSSSLHSVESSVAILAQSYKVDQLNGGPRAKEPI
jgi:hypothetical protein